MKSMQLRSVLATAAVTAGILAVPAESQAIFNWFGNCCGNQTPTYAAAAPAYTAPAAADPCCTPPQVQTVNYVPQTCYRTQYVNVPVTTYRPATGRDPCTGCPVTTMRPMTTMVQQARLVPYTTYRMVLTNRVAAPNPCCGATAPAMSTGYAPAYSGGLGYAPPASACCGASSAAPITYSSPASTPYYGSSTTSVVGSSTVVGSASNAAATAPTLAPSSPNRTFQQTSPSLKLEKPIQADEKEPADKGLDTGATSDQGAGVTPRLFQPNDRTTSYPILRVNVHRPVSYRELHATPAAPRSTPDADGWRTSTR